MSQEVSEWSLLIAKDKVAEIRELLENGASPNYEAIRDDGEHYARLAPHTARSNIVTVKPNSKRNIQQPSLSPVEQAMLNASYNVAILLVDYGATIEPDRACKRLDPLPRCVPKHCVATFNSAAKTSTRSHAWAGCQCGANDWQTNLEPEILRK